MQSRTSTSATLWFPNTWWTQAAAAAELDPAGHRADPATLTARSHHYHDDLDLFHFSFWFIFLHTNTRLLLNLRQLRYGAGGFSYKSTWTLQELFPLIIVVVNICHFKKRKTIILIKEKLLKKEEKLKGLKKEKLLKMRKKKVDRLARVSERKSC